MLGITTSYFFDNIFELHVIGNGKYQTFRQLMAFAAENIIK